MERMKIMMTIVDRGHGIALARLYEQNGVPLHLEIIAHGTASSEILNMLGLTSKEAHLVRIFAFGGKLWITSRGNCVSFRDGGFAVEEPYVPLVVAGAAPSGGGTTIENINLLSSNK